MIQFCPRHRLGFNDDLDPSCPQCTMAGLEPPETYAVDQTSLDVKIPAGASDKRPINLKARK